MPWQYQYINIKASTQTKIYWVQKLFSNRLHICLNQHLEPQESMYRILAMTCTEQMKTEHKQHTLTFGINVIVWRGIRFERLRIGWEIFSGCRFQQVFWFRCCVYIVQTQESFRFLVWQPAMYMHLGVWQ
jgi:hypothetical protein